MSKIIKLDKNLANQIAAGEVVERPMSVVKELLENSIDAGSTNIKVELQEGGIKQIIIYDNGFGIEKEDLGLAIEKYSTSKIKNLNDLYNVMTFGFRGEALASIASVSKMQIISKTIDGDNAYGLIIEGGEKGGIKTEVLNEGTKIIIDDLFFNTPARLNYLKKPRTEYVKIYDFMQQMSLSYPEIGFELFHDTKKVFKYNRGENLKTRIYNVYGSDFSNNLLEIDFNLPGINITGYISDPKVSFPTKNKQTIFVNKRVIKSPLIMKSIYDAYNRYIPHSMNSAYVLNLDIDPTQVDVNVHPRKLEVRFADESSIFRGFYHAVDDKLKSVSLLTSNISTGNDTSNKFVGTGSFENKIEEPQKQYYTGSGTKFKSYSPYKNTSANPNQGEIKDALNFSKSISQTGLTDEKDPFSNQKTDNIANNPRPVSDEGNADIHYTAMGKIIGQTFNSYIIVETDNGLKILDQHALAERVIYEKLVNKKQKLSVQGLLLSQSIKLNLKQLEILEVNNDLFIEMGFEFEIMGGGIIVNAIPDYIKKENLELIIIGVIDDIGEYSFNKSKTLEEVKNKAFAYMACRSAIKFGNKLNLFEINKLLNDSVLDYSATCPHGRPVIFEIGLDEMKDKYER